MPITENRIQLNLKTILLATDFSTASDKASLYAKALARHYGSTVELAHVIDMSVSVAALEAALTWSMVDTLRDASETMLQQKAEDLAFAGIPAKANVIEGTSPAAELLKRAEQVRADLIVMGTTGKHGLERVLLGSSAEAVMHRARCPVLTVGPAARAPAQDSLNFENVVYATDFSQESALGAVFAFSFAQECGAHLYLCHVLPDHKAAAAEKKALEDGFQLALNRLIPPTVKQWCEPEGVVEHGDAVAGILALAGRVKADLIVMGARRVGDWLTQVRSGIAYKVCAQASCPVLTIRR